MRVNHYEEPREWAEHNFTGAEMSDVRRISRVINIAEAMASSPGSSIPEMFAHPYDVKAAYKLFRTPGRDARVLAAAGLEKGKKCPLALASDRRAA